MNYYTFRLKKISYFVSVVFVNKRPENENHLKENLYSNYSFQKIQDCKFSHIPNNLDKHMLLYILSTCKRNASFLNLSFHLKQLKRSLHLSVNIDRVDYIEELWEENRTHFKSIVQGVRMHETCVLNMNEYKNERLKKKEYTRMKESKNKI